MATKGTVLGVIANMVTLTVDGPVAQNEICYISTGGDRLMAEVIKVVGKNVYVQVFESTRGLKVGAEAEFTGHMLEVTLGPGMLSKNYDGLQNDLDKMEGVFLKRGQYTYPLDKEKKWLFKPIVKAGDELGLRLLAMVIFACGVIASYMLTNYTNLHMRKLAIWVDAAGLGLTALLPDWFSPIAGVYPIFFCSAFQWGVYSGADGFNSATVFITNNFKQSVLGWTQYALTKDKEFKRKAVLYSNTVLMFFLGALLGVTGVAAFGNALGACVGFIPLAVARIFISIGELPVEDETPEETEEEAEEMLEEAKILEKEEKKKI